MVKEGWWLGVALALTGCGPGDTVPGSEPVTQEAAPAAAATDGADTSTALLLERGVRAMQEGRITRPMGDSALDLFVTLHGREPDNAGVETALVELRPYVLLAAERAIAAGDLDDAERLVGALAMFDPDAAALPRLREALAGARDRLAAAGHEPFAEGGRGPAAESETAESSIASSRLDDTPPATANAAESPTRTAAAAVEPVGETEDRTGPVAAAGSRNVPVAPTARGAIRSGPSAPNDVAPPVATPPTRAAPPASAPAPIADDAPPVLIRDAAPEYPLSAMRRGLSGRVRLEFTVRPDGGIADVAVLSSSPEGVFDQAAIAAARQWRFEPRRAPTTSVRELRFDAPRR